MQTQKKKPPPRGRKRYHPMLDKLSRNTLWQISIFRITIAVSILFFLANDQRNAPLSRRHDDQPPHTRLFLFLELPERPGPHLHPRWPI